MSTTFFPPFFGFPSIFVVVWIILFCVIVGAIIHTLVTSIKENVKNNNSPILNVSAIVVSRRIKVSRRGRHSTGNHTYVGRDITTYYVTFQFDSGDRLELKVNDHEYGMLVENDKGNLKFQGTRYLEFNRDR